MGGARHSSKQVKAGWQGWQGWEVRARVTTQMRTKSHPRLLAVWPPRSNEYAEYKLVYSGMLNIYVVLIIQIRRRVAHLMQQVLPPHLATNVPGIWRRFNPHARCAQR